MGDLGEMFEYAQVYIKEFYRWFDAKKPRVNLNFDRMVRKAVAYVTYSMVLRNESVEAVRYVFLWICVKWPVFILIKKREKKNDERHVGPVLL